MYKWIDRHGVTRFSDTPPPVDAASAVHTLPSVPTAAEYPAVGVPPPLAEEPTPTASTAPVSPAVTASAVSVEIYTIKGCGWCRKSKAFFTSRNIPFIEHDIEKDPEAARRRAQMKPPRGVPMALVNGRSIMGYDEKAYLQALGR
jgi:glutaredoxin